MTTEKSKLLKNMKRNLFFPDQQINKAKNKQIWQ